MTLALDFMIEASRIEEKKMIKSPLRYPGGKSRFINQIVPYIYNNYAEYREPFVGGGSVFLACLQDASTDAIYRINDFNYEVYAFWKELKGNGQALIANVQKIKNEYSIGKKLYDCLIAMGANGNDLEVATRFFVLNRITFSGTNECGGYSNEAFKKRFTQSSIDRLKPFPKLLEKVEVSFGDYATLLLQPAYKQGTEVFVFLDPPYIKPKAKLYGNKGHLHKSFDHLRFAENMKKCNHKWLITYDDSPDVRELFSFANLDVIAWEAQYGMNNVASNGKAEKGKELLISNYPLQSCKR